LDPKKAKKIIDSSKNNTNISISKDTQINDNNILNSQSNVGESQPKPKNRGLMKIEKKEVINLANKKEEKPVVTKNEEKEEENESTITVAEAEGFLFGLADK